MMMNREFIEHNKQVDYLRAKERQEHLNSSFDRYINKINRRKDEDFESPRW